MSANFSPELNWIYGENGQGKTNLIEAVHYLCNLESFRTRKPSLLLQEKKHKAVLQAQVKRRQVQHNIRVNITKKGRHVFLDQSPSRRVSEYIFTFMALSFTPEDVNLFRNVPQERRKFFNRIIAFKDPAYLKNIQEYSKIIAQKNALLRRGNTEQIPLWNGMLASSAIHLMKHCDNFVEEINFHLNDIFMLAGQSFVSFWGVDENDIGHSLRSVLLDPERRLLKAFDGMDWRPDATERDIRNILKAYSL